jgi:hypothetical protein
MAEPVTEVVAAVTEPASVEGHVTWEETGPAILEPAAAGRVGGVPPAAVEAGAPTEFGSGLAEVTFKALSFSMTVSRLEVWLATARSMVELNVEENVLRGRHTQLE